MMNDTTEQKKTTRVLFLIDESGSMLPMASDVRGGFNGYVETLLQDGNSYRLSVVKFGSTVRPLVDDLPLEEVPALTDKDYQPSDLTALYDAIGHAFKMAQSFPDVSGEHPYGIDPVLLIIMTDGFENSSHEYSKAGIVAGIKERENAGNWTTVYLGADQDAWAIAGGLGMAQGNTMSFAGSETRVTLDYLAHATSSAATSGTRQTRSFFHQKPESDHGSAERDSSSK